MSLFSHCILPFAVGERTWYFQLHPFKGARGGNGFFLSLFQEGGGDAPLLVKGDHLLLGLNVSPTRNEQGRGVSVRVVVLISVGRFAVANVVFRPQSRAAPRANLELQVSPMVANARQNGVGGSTLREVLHKGSVIVGHPFMVVRGVGIHAHFVRRFYGTRRVMNIADLEPLLTNRRATRVVDQVGVLARAIASSDSTSVICRYFPRVTNNLTPVPITFRVNGAFRACRFQCLNVNIRADRFVLLSRRELRRNIVEGLVDRFRMTFITNSDNRVNGYFIRPSVFTTRRVLCLFVTRLKCRAGRPIHRFRRRFLYLPTVNLGDYVAGTNVCFVGVMGEGPTIIRSRAKHTGISFLCFFPRFTPI